MENGLRGTSSAALRTVWKLTSVWDVENLNAWRVLLVISTDDSCLLRCLCGCSVIKHNIKAILLIGRHRRLLLGFFWRERFFLSAYDISIPKCIIKMQRVKGKNQYFWRSALWLWFWWAPRSQESWHYSSRVFANGSSRGNVWLRPSLTRCCRSCLTSCLQLLPSVHKGAPTRVQSLSHSAIRWAQRRFQPKLPGIRGAWQVPKCW